MIDRVRQGPRFPMVAMFPADFDAVAEGHARDASLIVLLNLSARTALRVELDRLLGDRPLNR